MAKWHGRTWSDRFKCDRILKNKKEPSLFPSAYLCVEEKHRHNLYMHMTSAVGPLNSPRLSKAGFVKSRQPPPAHSPPTTVPRTALVLCIFLAPKSHAMSNIRKTSPSMSYK